MKILYKELNVDGFVLRGFLSEPDTSYDTVCVMLHGFTGHKNENNFMFKDLSRILCEEGIATVRFDYRGSGDSDGYFADQNFNTVLKDAEAMYQFGKSLPNAKKVILLGFSMGGATASVLGVRHKDELYKLILMSPAGCMPELTENIFAMNKVIEPNMVDLGGFLISKEFYYSFMNVDLYKDIETYTGKVLITQGLSDTAVDPRYTHKYFSLYPHAKYVLIEGAPHCYSKLTYRKPLFEEIVKFIREK